MDRSKVDALIPEAQEEIRTQGIYKDGYIDNTFRGQISSFGAAVTMGGLLSAIAFFSKKGIGSDVDRSLLMKAIYSLIKGHDAPQVENSLYEYVKQEIRDGREDSVKEDVINAALAVKLAINLFYIKPKKPKEGVKNE